MNNKELFDEFKKQVAIYNFEQEEQRTGIYPLEKNTKEWRKYIMKKRILQTLATLVLICTFGMTVYAQVTGNLNFKNMGLLKASENFENKKIDVNKTIENDYVKISIDDIARDSAYLIIEYRIFLKEKTIKEMENVEYDKIRGYNIGISSRVWINEKKSERSNSTVEKISDKEYKCSDVINLMNFDEETIHLKLWLNEFYIGNKTAVKINKMLEMDITMNKYENQQTITQEQKIDNNTKIVLDKIENSSFETYIRLKRITENITWKEYNENIEYYRFKVASDDNDTLTSNCYDISKKIYKDNNLIEDYSELKNSDIIKAEEVYAVILGKQTDLKKLKVMQTKSTFFSDRTNEEKEAYYKAKWYPLKEGEEQYSATNNNGGTFTINKITIDDENIVFYFDKKGIFGETSYIDLRVNNGTMNYICPTKIEEKSLTSDENKIIFSRDSFGAGLNIREGMLDDLSKVEFTMLYGDADKIIGDPLIIDIPEQSNEKVKIQNIKINDTISEEYVYNYGVVSPVYDENLKETDNVEYQKKEMHFEINSYEDKVLNKNNNLFINGNSYYLKSSENVNDLKEEIESYFTKDNIEYKVDEIKSGELQIK